MAWTSAYAGSAPVTRDGGGAQAREHLLERGAVLGQAASGDVAGHDGARSRGEGLPHRLEAVRQSLPNLLGQLPPCPGTVCACAWLVAKQPTAAPLWTALPDGTLPRRGACPTAMKRRESPGMTQFCTNFLDKADPASRSHSEQHFYALITRGATVSETLLKPDVPATPN